MTNRSRTRLARGEPYAHAYAHRALERLWPIYARPSISDIRAGVHGRDRVQRVRPYPWRAGAPESGPVTTSTGIPAARNLGLRSTRSAIAPHRDHSETGRP